MAEMYPEYPDLVGPPVIYQTEEPGFLMVLLECGHFTLVSKGCACWSDSSFGLSCDVCGGLSVLHPLVLLEFDYWKESA
jgi:hypothetical protein